LPSPFNVKGKGGKINIKEKIESKCGKSMQRWVKR
jgi:hypothetical protein